MTSHILQLFYCSQSINRAQLCYTYRCEHSLNPHPLLLLKRQCSPSESFGCGQHGCTGGSLYPKPLPLTHFSSSRCRFVEFRIIPLTENQYANSSPSCTVVEAPCSYLLEDGSTAKAVIFTPQQTHCTQIIHKRSLNRRHTTSWKYSKQCALLMKVPFRMQKLYFSLSN